MANHLISWQEKNDILLELTKKLLVFCLYYWTFLYIFKAKPKLFFTFLTAILWFISTEKWNSCPKIGCDIFNCQFLKWRDFFSLFFNIWKEGKDEYLFGHHSMTHFKGWMHFHLSGLQVASQENLCEDKPISITIC